jgi:hypothetical protein
MAGELGRVEGTAVGGKGEGEVMECVERGGCWARCVEWGLVTLDWGGMGLERGEVGFLVGLERGFEAKRTLRDFAI